jgi:hypothetical protein
MDIDTILKDLIKELELEGLPEAEQEEMLLAISTAIQKQFFLDVYAKIGKDMFEALEASVKMGEEFYGTTLKHLVPDYEEVFQSSRKKVLDSYKNAKPPEETAVVH